MKKKVLAGLLASMSLFGVAFSGSSAFAAEVKSDSDVTVGFSNHNEGGEDGNLELTYKPMTFDFNNSNALNKMSFDISSKQYVVVQDKRTAAQANEWQVTAELSDLLDASNNKLTGAKLDFVSEIKGYDASKGAPEAPNAITDKGTRTALAPALATGGLEQNNAAQTIMTDSDTVSGAYTGYTALELTGIKLTAPGNTALAGSQYSGTVTWTLTDAIV